MAAIEMMNGGDGIDHDAQYRLRREGFAYVGRLLRHLQRNVPMHEVDKCTREHVQVALDFLKRVETNDFLFERDTNYVESFTGDYGDAKN
jgi:ribosomal 50S subunit-associated protein YjgA (DUF615 family)